MCREQPGLTGIREGNRRQHQSHAAACVGVGGEDVILEVRGALLVMPSPSPLPQTSALVAFSVREPGLLSGNVHQPLARAHPVALPRPVQSPQVRQL